MRGAITVNTLLDRHLAAKRDRAPGTIEADRYHADNVRKAFGDRVVSTLDTTAIEIWSVREGVAADTRKKPGNHACVHQARDQGQARRGRPD